VPGWEGRDAVCPEGSGFFDAWRAGVMQLTSGKGHGLSAARPSSQPSKSKQLTLLCFFRLKTTNLYRTKPRRRISGGVILAVALLDFMP
jgi:hypothetical protein